MKQCGYIAIVGRPNVGKSTLLNKILDYKVSITSRKPQTTRHQIMGVKTLDQAQYIYVDTPGLHQVNPDQLNRYMNQAALSSLQDVDVILFVVALDQWNEGDEWVYQAIQRVNKPVILVVNKADRVHDGGQRATFMAKLADQTTIQQRLAVSAKQGHGIEKLEAKIRKHLPESPVFHFDPDDVTDKSMRFLVAETIREKLMRLLGDEVPYQLTVGVDNFKTQDNGAIVIDATIYVARDSQKGIVIGKQGSRLKKVGIQSRVDIEAMLETRVFLQLWVKVKADWSDDAQALATFGYSTT